MFSPFQRSHKFSRKLRCGGQLSEMDKARQDCKASIISFQYRDIQKGGFEQTTNYFSLKEKSTNYFSLKEK